MLRIITADKVDEWNGIVKSYEDWDIYYLCEYARSFELHGDGIPLLIEYDDGYNKFCYAVMKRDIADDPKFKGKLPKGEYFDFEAPYGYGGPISNHPISEQTQTVFLNELKKYANETGIVEQFVRFHPLIANQNLLPLIFETRYLHQTIYMDTSSPELIMTNMDSKNRNMVRKAIKSGVTIEKRPIDDYQDFILIYEETMDKDNAEQYYYFDKAYFEEQKKLFDYSCIVYAVKDGMRIAAAILYYNDRYMHYHLAGTHTEFRKYSPSNLLLYESACWASGRGIKQFHLGGGLAVDDNLFGFKKQFNKNGRLPFYVGRTIFDEIEYRHLMEIRKEINPDFNMDNRRMTQYRY